MDLLAPRTRNIVRATKDGQTVIGEEIFPDRQKEYEDLVKESQCCADTPQDEMPGMIEKAKNLTTSVGQHIRSGWAKASDEESERRWLICQECDKLINNEVCILCGCWMKLKVTWLEQRCKINKWDT
jgi:hypothetical protein